jgi:hypothetical protein
VIRVILNTQAPDYAAIQRDLVTEMNALDALAGISVRMESAAPPPGTLGVAEAYQFLIDHKDAALLLPALKAVLELVTAALRRHGAPPANARQIASATAIVVVGDNNMIGLPAPAERQRRFLTDARGKGKSRPAPRSTTTRGKARHRSSR